MLVLLLFFLFPLAFLLLTISAFIVLLFIVFAVLFLVNIDCSSFGQLDVPIGLVVQLLGRALPQSAAKAIAVNCSLTLSWLTNWS
jgi:hypothetical protein